VRFGLLRGGEIKTRKTQRTTIPVAKQTEKLIVGMGPIDNSDSLGEREELLTEPILVIHPNHFSRV
jgi:hypothetical protein